MEDNTSGVRIKKEVLQAVPKVGCASKIEAIVDGRNKNDRADSLRQVGCWNRQLSRMCEDEREGVASIVEYLGIDTRNQTKKVEQKGKGNKKNMCPENR